MPGNHTVSAVGEHFVLRPAVDGYAEIGRGRYAKAWQVWSQLVEEHTLQHRQELGQ